MSILIDDGSRVLVQGITGREGQFHTERMIRYGTRVVNQLWSIANARLLCL